MENNTEFKNLFERNKAEFIGKLSKYISEKPFSEIEKDPYLRIKKENGYSGIYQGIKFRFNIFKDKEVYLEEASGFKYLGYIRENKFIIPKFN